MNTEICLLEKRADLLRSRIARTDDVFLRDNLLGDLHHVDHVIATVLGLTA